MCQLRSLDEIEKNNSWFNDKSQLFIRKYRYYKKIISRSLFSGKYSKKILQINHEQLQPGSLVRVRSKVEILQTLDRYRKTDGCTFQSGMYAHCGKEFKVLKKVDRFYDESKNKMCKCNNLYVLEGSNCNGLTAYTGKCERNCFFFWHSSWLKLIGCFIFIFHFPLIDNLLDLNVCSVILSI
jgi:hypothetical protein